MLDWWSQQALYWRQRAAWWRTNDLSPLISQERAEEQAKLCDGAAWFAAQHSREETEHDTAGQLDRDGL